MCGEAGGELTLDFLVQEPEAAKAVVAAVANVEPVVG